MNGESLDQSNLLRGLKLCFFSLFIFMLQNLHFVLILCSIQKGRNTQTIGPYPHQLRQYAIYRGSPRTYNIHVMINIYILTCLFRVMTMFHLFNIWQAAFIVWLWYGECVGEGPLLCSSCLAKWVGLGEGPKPEYMVDERGFHHPTCTASLHGTQQEALSFLQMVDCRGIFVLFFCSRGDG